MPERANPNLLSLPAAAAKLGVGLSTLRRLIGRGEFVSAVQVAPRRIAFVETEIDAWVASRPRGLLPRPAISAAPAVPATAESQTAAGE